MKLENQVCTLEQAKKLKELGIVQDSLFEWIETKIMIEDLQTRELHEQISRSIYPFGTKIIKTHDRIVSSEHCAAFTVAELGLMLGNNYSISEPLNNRRVHCLTMQDEETNMVAITSASAMAESILLQIAYCGLEIETINNRLSPTIQESEP